MIAQVLQRIITGQTIEVSYNEWKRDPEAGSESRDRNVYYAYIREKDFEGLKPKKRVHIYMPDLWYLMWHGLELVGIWSNTEKGRPVLVLEFEREGIYVHETEQKGGLRDAMESALVEYENLPDWMKIPENRIKRVSCYADL